MHPIIKNTAIGICSWALVCLVAVLPKSISIIKTFGSWKYVLFFYGVLFIGGMAILPIFLSLDRIKSEQLKFAAQMFACLLIAIVVLIAIGIYTF